MQVMSHPWFQRLRRIKQMGMAHLVYPGAMHTRFHHSLGACHLMGKALEVLRTKGVHFSDEECVAARLAILMHDIGHGPFSHALEHSLIPDIQHESISLAIMQRLNLEMDGSLGKAVRVFDHAYPKPYLHQLVSSQLDMDRMDYLNRDSYFTGVSEGVIGYDRILQMLTVVDGQLMVEEKAVHSAEKFIIARRLMYWQVYLHKTVLGAEQLQVNILRRAKELAQAGEKLFCTPALHHFLYNNIDKQRFDSQAEHLEIFCQLDDSDIISANKVWMQHSDKVLSTLCTMLVNRNLYKVVLSADPLENLFEEKKEALRRRLQCSEHELGYYITTGTTSNNTYDTTDEHIYISMKDGSIREISQVDDPLVNQALARPVHKNYICFLQPAP